MGGKLGMMLARTGLDTVLRHARTDEKSAGLVRGAGRPARARTRQEATQDVDAILLGVHWPRVHDALHEAGERGQ
jgi:predicted dinucleotide-binding enzyme